MVPIRLVGVRVDFPSNQPIVLLRSDDTLLPIFIGNAEASAIALALEGAVPPRPLTHDLMRDVLVALGVEVAKVVISDVRDGTFFAELHLLDRVGRETVVSCRPSDGLALAVRTGAPLWASAEVIEEAGVIAPSGLDEVELLESETGPATGEPVTAPTDEELEAFRAFLDDVRPEDFEEPQ